MGAWGAGILQDDSAMDIIDEYRILLGYKVPNKEAYRLIKDHYYPDFKGMDDEDIFWFALAIYQVRNGILEDEVKEKAFEFLENPPSMDVWKESGENIYKNRLKVLSKLKEELLNPSVTEPKKIPKPPSYYRFKTKFKEGDLLACQIEGKVSEEYVGKYFLIQVISVLKIPISNIKPELDYSSMLVVAMYKWIGNKIHDINDVDKFDFLKLRLSDTIVLSEDNNSKKYMSVIGNNTNYKKMMFNERPGIYEGYCGMINTIYTAIEKLRKQGEKFEILDN